MLKRQVAVLATLFCFLAPAGAFAQGALGTITGTITDSTGAVIPDAAITITQIDTAVARKISSSSAGYYRISVPPGTYRIEITKEGFKSSIVDKVIVPVAQVVTQDISLEVGQLRQAVTVTAAPPLLTPDSAMISTSMSPKEFATLPIALDDGGRNYNHLFFQSAGNRRRSLGGIPERRPTLQRRHHDRRCLDRPLRFERWKPDGVQSFHGFDRGI